MNDLVHFGILGMKWGVRRYQNEDGTLTEAGKRRLAKREARSESKKERLLKSSTNRKEKAVRKEINIRKMSNEDLTEVINRLQLEKRYKDLMNELHPAKEHVVRKFIAEYAGKAARQYADAAIKNAIESRFSKPKEESVTEKAAKMEAEEKIYRINQERAKRQQESQAESDRARRENNESREEEENRRRNREMANYRDRLF